MCVCVSECECEETERVHRRWKEREERQGKEVSETRWGARTTYLNRLQLSQMLYVYTSQDSCKTPHLPVTPSTANEAWYWPKCLLLSGGQHLFSFFKMWFIAHICTHVHTHMCPPQRMEEASKELNALRLALEMIKEQLKIPDVETGSGLSRKEKQG